jgi:hypothetical protein
MIRALRHKWIERHPNGTPYVNATHLPPHAQTLWHQFWETYDPAGILPHGRAAELDQEFFKVTGTTPLDLEGMAEELVTFLAKGYRVEQLLTGKGTYA